MKIFVWHDVLCDYTCGYIAVVAENLKEAQNLMKNKLENDTFKNYPHLMENPDEIFETPSVLFCWGSA